MTLSAKNSKVLAKTLAGSLNVNKNDLKLCLEWDMIKLKSSNDSQ